jgi:hypothetical protein
MSGAVPLLPLYAFLAWTGRTLSLTYITFAVDNHASYSENRA